MVSKRKIIKQFGGNICRQCINKTNKIHLLHSDCRYELMYPRKCPCCGEMKNIVTGFVLSGYVKSIFKKKGKYSSR